MANFYANNRCDPIRVSIIAFECTKLLDVAGPLQVFTDARTASGERAYLVEVTSEAGGAISTDTICQISTRAFNDCAVTSWDTVLVSGGDSAMRAMKSGSIHAALDVASKSCRRLGSICLGAFVLAAGGYLSGRRATTHWDGCAALANQFPDITVEDDSIFVDDEKIWTSAGVTAGIDMALEMVKRDFGAAEALRIAKSLVLPVHRSGGQRQFSEPLSTQIVDVGTRFADLIHWVTSNLQRRHSVSDMASRTNMSDRNFSRQFTQEMGLSPAQYVLHLRVMHAASLLHRENITLAAAQKDAGFSSSEQMRKAFQRSLGVSPSAYAEKFAS